MTPAEKEILVSELDAKALEAAARALANACDCDRCLVHLRKQARAAVSAYLAASGDGWQPIETAPKDGKAIDLYVLGPLGFGRRLPFVWWGLDPDGWYGTTINADGSNAISGGLTPTHWMPIPAPPSSELKSSQD